MSRALSTSAPAMAAALTLRGSLIAMPGGPLTTNSTPRKLGLDPSFRSTVHASHRDGVRISVSYGTYPDELWRYPCGGIASTPRRGWGRCLVFITFKSMATPPGPARGLLRRQPNSLHWEVIGFLIIARKCLSTKKLRLIGPRKAGSLVSMKSRSWSIRVSRFGGVSVWFQFRRAGPEHDSAEARGRRSKPITPLASGAKSM